MSTTSEEFLDNLRIKLAGLTLRQIAHTIQRLYEKLRLIHNAVGDVYMHRKTINEFKTAYPNVFNKLKAKMAPYMDGDYITEEGWNFFLDNMFDPRHDVITTVLLEIRKRLRTETAENEVDAF